MRLKKLYLRLKLILVTLLISIGLLIGVITILEIDLNPFKDRDHYEPWNSIYQDRLAVGDIIFRTAYGKESRFVQWVSGGEFSHIALITATTPEIIVTHATTNDEATLPNQVLATPIEKFLSPTFAKSYLIARPEFLPESERSLFAEMVAEQVGEPYLLKGRDEVNLYCTTLLEIPLQKLAPDLTAQLSWRALSLPGVAGEYLFPDTFLSLPNMLPLLVDDNWVESVISADGDDQD
ncbi:YiiX/YebB-like N1pC/P60 family cysteine hydrolase [Ignatzschineria cameli]|uniref:Uncharacterized protein n=1 Tax=Ignatzschineria cameli TaxID=2182793 RepID=A0A2U2ATB5_9GAMM|nr:YiiX/YebB-like N1pC/P60 family cysteine hydrolase [Ignatzschineria cameli]PWD87979.1 hypothetical protein DC077_01490 [Ignatzschineria cameli]PWD91011.1 hypothetical protein DC079_02245 [Ignatzschineria cameli]PWD92653.1 hypothetical protein DC081_02245 [Ignatzschineria cameli]PWD93673.1 hypothetical protein DC078_02245 [Ignatzschineria cameli]